jgi:anti-repressor protein
MDNQIRIFNSPQFGDVRVVLDNQGEPKFCLKDVCNALELTPKFVNQRLGDKVVSNNPILDSLGRRHNVLFVNEDGLYDVVLESRKPEARAFRKWVTGEVLPSIRKHGAYMTDKALEEALLNPDFGIQLMTKLKEERQARQALEQQMKAQDTLIAQKEEIIAQKDTQIAQMTESSAYCDMVLNSHELVDITQIAQDYGTTAVRMNRYLNALGIQYKENGQWILYAKYKGEGYVHSVTHKISPNQIKMSTKWTQRGRLFLYQFLKSHGVLPILEQYADYRHPIELQIK